jgi:hypothetical protein
MVKSPSFLFVVFATLLVLGLAGCESTGGIAARVREKAPVYAALKTWERKYIDRGSVAVGFTPDMVYIALGRPTSIATGQFPGGPAELWTYARAYPNAEAIRGFKHTRLTLESAYQAQTPPGPPNFAKPPATISPLADKTTIINSPTGSTPSIGQTGGPQGGSLEPADLSSYTIQVLFANGQVVRLSAMPNAN